MTEANDADLLELRHLDELFVAAVTRATNYGLAAKEAEVLHDDHFTARRLYELSRQSLEAARDLEELVAHQMATMLADAEPEGVQTLATVLQFPTPAHMLKLNFESSQELAAARIHDLVSSREFQD